MGMALMALIVSAVLVAGAASALADGGDGPQVQPGQAGAGRTVDRTALWQRSGRNLLAGFVNMYQPCVIDRPDETYRYRMWFFGSSATETNSHLGLPGCDMIFHARSRDLERWDVWCGQDAGGQDQWDIGGGDIARWRPVVSPGGAFYDAWHNGDPSVVWRDGVYYMAYSATSMPFDKPVAGHPWDMVCCVMGATSRDGVHWQRVAEPLLIAPGNESSPLADAAAIGEFDRPCLMWEDGRWRLWFDYVVPGKGLGMGHAVNTGEFAAPGGFGITHPLDQPLLDNWPNPEVVKVGAWYYGFADPAILPGATGWAARQVAEARSPDGLHWEVLGYVRPEADTPACQIPQACVLTVDGKQWLYVFYACQIGGEPYNWRYDRIRCMRRPVE